ncbi:hypothetical protein [Jeotgalibacillus proteolyticus]|uniref:Uncharacterized protein n=1 Tax=Jeotgalibacillus proteolyticus TaxID=2082395 RepID=A0A2S5G8B3_9BACL|nr:hypothetical protein [Jeotgalibacillus proteolyticus]PPA69237.1 hypothetical protein C4B60_15645 [Jeotgalibacillus proteolyticus]
MRGNGLLTQKEFEALLADCLRKGNEDASVSLLSMVEEIKHKMLHHKKSAAAKQESDAYETVY